MERAAAGRNGGFLTQCKNGTNRKSVVFYIGLSSDYMAFLLQQLQYFTDPCGGNRCQTCRMGSYQSSGRMSGEMIT